MEPIGGTEFITAPEPEGFGMRFYTDGDGTVSGKITLKADKQGPPGHAHGGALIALLDEAMGAAAWSVGYRVVAVNLNFNLKRAVPLNTEITIRGKVESKEDRKVFTSGQVILADGTIAVDCTGLFLEAPAYVGGDYNPFVMKGQDHA
jgi:acyl-coenzyme A thioesterase PaaI-like protein